LLRLSFLLREAASLLFSSSANHGSQLWKEDGAKRGQSSQGRTGWLGSVSSERESGGWVGLGCGSVLRGICKEKEERWRRDGMSSKGRKGRKGRLTRAEFDGILGGIIKSLSFLSSHLIEF
jgi:hypothetical protein